MAILDTFTQQPADRIDYLVDYTEFLEGQDVVRGAETTVEPSGLVVQGTTAIDETRVKFWVSGGVDGEDYKVTITMTTVKGRVKQDELKFKIKDF